MFAKQLLIDDIAAKMPRFVACDHCGTQFVFFTQYAGDALPADCYGTQGAHYADQTERIAECVRCPDCGQLPGLMAARLQRKLVNWASFFYAAFLLSAFAVWDFQWMVLDTFSTSTFIVGIFILFSGLVLVSAVRRIDVNNSRLTYRLCRRRHTLRMDECITLRKEYLAQRGGQLAAERARREDKEGRWRTSVDRYISHLENDEAFALKRQYLAQRAAQVAGECAQRESHVRQWRTTLNQYISHLKN